MATNQSSVRLEIVPTEGTLPTRLSIDLEALGRKAIPDRDLSIKVVPTVSASQNMPQVRRAAPQLLLVQANSFGATEAMRLLNQGGETAFVAAQLDGIYPRIPFGARRIFKAIQRRQPVAYIPPDVRRRNDASREISKRHLAALQSLLILAVEGQEIAHQHWANTNQHVAATPHSTSNGKASHVPS